jgi:hypothetical protein
VVLNFPRGRDYSFSNISYCGKLAVAKNGGCEGVNSSLVHPLDPNQERPRSPMPGRFAHPRPTDQLARPAKKGGFFATILLRCTQAVMLFAWIPARGLGATIRKRIEEAFGWIKTVSGEDPIPIA